MPYYNSYYANGYNNIPNNYLNPMYTTQQPQNMVQAMQQGNGIVIVPSEGDAQAYPVAPGNTQWLKDQYKSYLYVKTVDASGIAMPLRKFHLVEENIIEQQPEMTTQTQTQETPKVEFNPDLYVTWEALEKRLAELQPPKPAVTNKYKTVQKKVVEDAVQQ